MSLPAASSGPSALPTVTGSGSLPLSGTTRSLCRCSAGPRLGAMAASFDDLPSGRHGDGARAESQSFLRSAGEKFPCGQAAKYLGGAFLHEKFSHLKDFLK